MMTAMDESSTTTTFMLKIITAKREGANNTKALEGERRRSDEVLDDVEERGVAPQQGVFPFVYTIA